MGSGEKSSRNFHLHHNQGKKQTRDVPKGCLAIKVGSQGEEQQRFVVPVIYFNHPLFIQLLKEAEEEYGFDQKGTITIPCHVQDFTNVRCLIDREKSLHHVGCAQKKKKETRITLLLLCLCLNVHVTYGSNTNELLALFSLDVVEPFMRGHG
ncbi:hypothetical protein GQ457_11G001800 [Hibiscus cannabinus]